jgi:sulfur-oxidizing protein SoxZ
MAKAIKLKVRLKGDLAEVKSLVPHPMETGTRTDPDTGEIISRHHITQLTFSNNGKPVLVVNCSTAVARDPYFSFSFRGASPGDKFLVSWVDNTGQTDSLETTLG